MSARLRRPNRDVLHKAEYQHSDDSRTCESLRCSGIIANVVERSERPSEDIIRVHQGLIASGNQVLRDTEQRDYYAPDVLAFEMEAAGLGRNTPWLVVRGICDYCDTHKNKDWQDYAAATAAAYTYMLLCSLPALAPDFGEFKVPFGLPEAPYLDEFIGRESELKRIHDYFQSPSLVKKRKVMVIQGLGGMGKTQLAIQYARLHQEEYFAVLWLKGNSESSLQESMALAAKTLHMHHSDSEILRSACEASQPNESSDFLLEWLALLANSYWLMIFDSVDEPDTTGSPVGVDRYDPRRYFPVTEHGCILITSRSPKLDSYKSLCLSKIFAPHEAISILQTRSRKIEIAKDPNIQKLLVKLDGLPLALASAGAYLRGAEISVAEYLTIYEESFQEIADTEELSEYDKTLWTTWDITIRQIEQGSKLEHEGAVALLRLWKYFCHQDVWYELLHGGVDYARDEVYKHVLSSFTSFRKSMRLLLEAGLVQMRQVAAPFVTDHNCVQSGALIGYSMHTCVHDWLCHKVEVDVDSNRYFLAAACIGSDLAHVDKPENTQQIYRSFKHACHLGNIQRHPSFPVDTLYFRFLDAMDLITAFLRVRLYSEQTRAVLRRVLTQEASLQKARIQRIS